jgi:hypothetical protein
MSQPIDWAKVAEYSKVVQEYTEIKEKKGRLFDPKKLVEDSRRVINVWDPELGVISYRPLTYADLAEINKETTNERKTAVALFLMLRKTYPDLTMDDVNEFGLDAVVRLLKIMVGPTGFLPVPAKSENGSTQTPKPR